MRFEFSGTRTIVSFPVLATYSACLWRTMPLAPKGGKPVVAKVASCAAVTTQLALGQMRKIAP